MTDSGSELVAGVKKSAVAIDREYRHVRSRVLDAHSGGIAQANIVLIAGRQKCAWLVDRKGEPGSEPDLCNFVDVDTIVRQFSPDCVKESELRRKTCKSYSQLGLTVEHFFPPRTPSHIEFHKLIGQLPQNRSRISNERHFRFVQACRLLRIGVDAYNLQVPVQTPLRYRVE